MPIAVKQAASVLQEFGVCGTIPQIFKSQYAHDSAAVGPLQRLSAISMGIRQGCLKSLTVF